MNMLNAMCRQIVASFDVDETFGKLVAVVVTWLTHLYISVCDSLALSQLS